MKVSVLGFGAMRLPRNTEEGVALLRRAMALGVNYLDTARGYLDGESERMVGLAVKGCRDQVYISTKRPMGPWHSLTEAVSPDEYRRSIEQQLERMGLDYVDVWHLHGLLWEAYCKFGTGQNGIMRVVHKAKEEGLIRHIAFSCHDTPQNLMRLIDTGEFEAVTLQYNLLDRSNEEAIAYAHERGLGVVVMGPVGGGRLAGPSAFQQVLPGGSHSSAEIALRFVIANPGVSVAISGMSTLSQVEENVATASRLGPLTDAERQAVAASLAEMQRLADLYCTGCNYCMPCPNGVDIPRNFALMHTHRVYGLTEVARTQYAAMPETGESGLRASACLQCGECEPKCPQRIAIMDQLQETHLALAP